MLDPSRVNLHGNGIGVDTNGYGTKLAFCNFRPSSYLIAMRSANADLEDPRESRLVRTGLALASGKRVAEDAATNRIRPERCKQHEISAGHFRPQRFASLLPIGHGHTIEPGLLPMEREFDQAYERHRRECPGHKILFQDRASLSQFDARNVTRVQPPHPRGTSGGPHAARQSVVRRRTTLVDHRLAVAFG